LAARGGRAPSGEEVARAVASERELLLSPSWWAALARERPDLAVRHAVRRGRAANELTRYRYDVLVRTSPPAAAPPPAVAWTPALDLTALAALAGPVLVTGVPNARLGADGGVDPEDLPGTAGWSAHGPAGTLDLLVGGDGWLPPPDRPGVPLANDPAGAARAARVEREVRAELATLLPAALVPAHLRVVPDLPVTASGKVDRAALPDPAPPRAPLGPYAPPRTAAERAVAESWADVLGA